MTKATLVGFNDETENAPITLPVPLTTDPLGNTAWEQVRKLFGNPDVAEVRVWVTGDDGRTRETHVIDAETFAEGGDWERQSEIVR
jgi:hypothetical protein